MTQVRQKKAPSVLKNKNFFLLFQGALTSAIAATLYSFAISFYILDITDNNASIQGIYLFVCGLVYVLCSFVGGVLADRWDKVKIVYGSDLLKGTLILSSMLLLRAFILQGHSAAQLAVLFTLGIINNLLAAVFEPASTALIPEILPSEQLMSANALFSIQRNLVSMLGIILAALFYALFPITALFGVIGALYVISGITELFIRVQHVSKGENLTLRVVFRDFCAGCQYLAGLKPVLCLILGALFVNFFMTPLTANLLPYVIKTDIAGSAYLFRDLINPEAWAAVFVLLVGLGSIIMSVVMGRREQKAAIGQGIKRWLAVLAMLLLAFATAYVLFARRNINAFLMLTCAGMFLVGFAVVGINLPINVVIQRDVQKGMLAKVSSIMTIGSQGMIPFSSLLAGILLSQLSAGVLAFFCAGGLVLTAVFVYCSKSIAQL